MLIDWCCKLSGRTSQQLAQVATRVEGARVGGGGGGGFGTGREHGLVGNSRTRLAGRADWARVERTTCRLERGKARRSRLRTAR